MVRRHQPQQQVMSAIQIHKIRDRSSGIGITYKLGSNSNSINAGTTPSDEFVTALDALRPIVIKICGLPDFWKDMIKMIGITLTPVGETNHSIVFVAKREMVAGSPFNISTPQRFMHIAEENDGTALVLDEEDRVAVEALIEQAATYVQTVREQELAQMKIGIDEVVDVESSTVEQPALDLVSG
jgi:hypothetical protein